MLDLGDRIVAVQVRRSPRARTTRIQVGNDIPLRVIVPAGTSDESAQKALRTKTDWVRTKLHAVEASRARPAVLGLEQPGVVWVDGAALAVRRAPVGFAQTSNSVLLVPDGQDSAAAVLRWYRRAARSMLSRLVAEESARLGLHPTAVAVRDQRTRWGSCSAAHRISLNWRLFLAPDAVARYVVIHELVHVQVPNHSKAFWRSLALADPNWQENAAWLREHGNELRRYDPGRAVVGMKL